METDVTDVPLVSPVISEFNDVLSTIGFSSSGLYSRWALIQFGLIILSVLIARFVASRLEDPIRDRLRGIEGQRGLLKFLVILARRMIWFFMAAQLWIAYFALQTITWKSHTYLIRTTAALVTAWLLISILSRVINNRFFARVIAVAAWTVAAFYIVGLLPTFLELLDSASFSVGAVRISLLSLLKSSLLLILFMWMALLGSQIIGNYVAQNEDISPSVKVLIQKVLRFFLLALAVLASLSAVGIDFTALAVFSGAVGIGIGLGLQKIVANFLSGIILLLDKSIKPGDVIEIDTVSGSTYGWVQHLGARYTAVRTRDGTETLIPNETFIDSPVTNWTHTNKAVRRKLPIGVSYDTDVEKAIALCLEAAEVTNRVLKVPKPVCLVKGFGDSSVDLELRFWLNDPEGGVANVSSLVYLEVWKRFQKAKIEIPFPQRDLNIRSSVPFELKQKK